MLKLRNLKMSYSPEKLTQTSVDGTQIDLDALYRICPQCFTESKDKNGELKHTVDFDKLKMMLGGAISTDKERYQFTWAGKSQAYKEAVTPINKTLRPCVEESVDWNTTQNLYIEGDNLEVLKLLEKTYMGKVKMIYIDPPYNTGNDFVYHDDFKKSENDENLADGSIDEFGNRYRVNSSSEGKFHSDWCSMMYSRLLVARKLLSEDGAIFVSIDDNEVDNLRKICKEIFGENNFIAQINWKGRGGKQDSKYYAVIHEYIICIAKDIDKYVAGEEIKSGDVYPKFDPKLNRFYKTQLLRKWGSNSKKADRPNLFYPIKAPDGSDLYPMLEEMTLADKDIFPNSGKEGCWRWGINTMTQAINEGRVEFIKQKNGAWCAYEKILAPKEGEEKTTKYSTWVDDVSNGTGEIKFLFGEKVFDYPKSTKLIKKFLKMGSIESKDIILDFFSGSATTAHAVMQLNAEDNGNRKFILVQLPELTDEKSEAFKAGFKSICEIGKERIRRAGKKIKEEFGDKAKDLDIGFRVLKCDSSNMQDVFFNPDETSISLLENLIDKTKDDRSDLDLLFGCLLDIGEMLSSPIESIDLEGKRIYSVNHGSIVACFEKELTSKIVDEIAKLSPGKVIFKESSFESCKDKINLYERFKQSCGWNDKDASNNIKVL